MQIKEYKENDFILLSGIQHFSFCKRQWGLIHIEQIWAENFLTVSGELMHQNAHKTSFREKRGDTIITRGMPVSSKNMGVSGACDVVEFKKDEINGVKIFGLDGKYSVVPVEYKHGELKEADILQVVAEALCLEEMLCCEIKHAYIYYGKTRHREKIDITSEKRDVVISMFNDMHRYFSAGKTPTSKVKKSCNSCSLKDICLPQISNKKSVKKYMEEIILGE